jgi:hypothetical protein
VTTESTRWLKSSHSENGGACVEWAPNDASVSGMISVRDSKAPSGPILRFPVSAFSPFVAGVKDGRMGGAV